MEISGIEKVKQIAKLSYIAIRRPRIHRAKQTVLNEYESGWKSYEGLLENSKNLDDWLHIKGYEDKPIICNVDGKMSFANTNMPEFNRKQLMQAVQQDFKNITSITEYGSGIGRNLLYIKKHYPHIKCYGYELCRHGVEIANRAKEKFGVDVEYSQLDFINDTEEQYVFPKTDLAFTMYALEQIPEKSEIALKHILEHVNLGTVHIEPVVENYPKTLRGMIGRLDHWKIDYLRNFETNLKKFKNIHFTKRQLNNAHNPLMFPSLYTITKLDVPHEKAFA